MLHRIYFSLIMAVVIFLTGCDLTDDPADNQQSIMELDIPADFDFSAQNDVRVDISLTDSDGAGISGIVYDLYYLNENDEPRFIRNNMTNTAGVLHSVLTVPSYVEEVMISGLMNTVQLGIENNQVEYSFSLGGNGRNSAGIFTLPEATRSFSFLDGITYNSQGVPNPCDIFEITSDMLMRVDTSLPESVSLLETHPQYLQEGVTTNFIITDSSDVWITFVTEGAGYKNALGFYTYDLEDGAPADPSSLDHILVFPNASLAGEGGGLNPGMQIYLGQFGADTVMGWFLVQNGWVNGPIVDQNALRFYSDRQYNPESGQYNQHQVLLYDSQSELFLVAFDDQVRPGGDQDFNDAVFFATANPIENIDTSGIEPIDIPLDSDDDGVNDPFDEYPDDPDRAFFVHYPAENETATLAFEDKWPQYGDYDMNDLVLDYYYRLVTNSADQVKDIRMEFVLRAAGAFFNNGFSILIPYSHADLTLAGFSGNLAPTLVPDGDYTIVDIFQSTAGLAGIEPGTYYNTDPDDPYYDNVAFSIDLTLSSAVPIENLDFSFPYNPFLRRQGSQNHEIHLMDFPPTSRHNTELFLTDDDNSDPANDSYYASPLNLPWALNLPESWNYPIEKAAITEAYLNFASWAESGGEYHQDWYLDSSENTENEKIYQTP